MRKIFLLFSLCLCLTACSTPTRVYYWKKANTGAERFVQDHNKCLERADFWPWSFSWSDNATTLDLRLRLKDGGIWANFIPYVGSMPIFVNAAHPSKTVIYWRYASCMREKGYSERRPYGGPL